MQKNVILHADAAVKGGKGAVETAKVCPCEIYGNELANAIKPI